MTGGGPVLVVAAHPDDEVLGCGGTLARHAAAGDFVHVLFLADGETSRQGAGKAEIARREAAAARAADLLGAQQPRFLRLPDNRLDGTLFLDIVQVLEEAVADLAPRIVYCHHPGDLNLDHLVAARAVVTAFRPMPESSVAEIRAFEVPSSTEWSFGITSAAFTPNLFIDITKTFEKKLQALAAYDAEMRPFPHPRSLEALEAIARRWGSVVGRERAEAFQIIRSVQ
jgi:N-acetylglucosamine malate deacetylase 1